MIPHLNLNDEKVHQMGEKGWGWGHNMFICKNT